MVAPKKRRVVRIESFGGPDVLTPVVEPMPHVGQDDVVIEVAAAGVNFADTMVRRGTYRKTQGLPHLPGAEVAGTVAHAPPCSGLEPGMHVAGFLEHGGGYTNYAVERFGRLGPGKTVLVTAAASGVGGLAVQLAKDLGSSAIGTASTADKRAYAEELGCLFTFDPGDPDLSAKVIDATGGNGVDAVIDSIGGELFPTLLACLAHNGTFVVVGSSTQEAGMLDVRHLIPRGQTICGLLVRRVADADPEEPRRALRYVLSRLKAGAIANRVERIPLDQAARAHTLLESRTSVGKFVLVP